MLEAGQRVGAAQLLADARVLYSCGAPMKGVDLRIVHPDCAEPCEDGHVGEIWLSSPCVTAGYYNRPALNREVFQVCLKLTLQHFVTLSHSSYSRKVFECRSQHSLPDRIDITSDCSH